MALKPLEVKTSNIATYAVTESRIAKNAVTTDKIVDGSVTETKLKAGAVTTAKIKDKAVTGAKIADATITQDKLVLPIVVPAPITRPIAPPVETAEIKDGTITRPKIAVAAVETDNIKDLNVTGGKLVSSAVTTPKIADGAVTPAKLSFSPATRPLVPPITKDEIDDGTIETPKIKDGAVTALKIATNAVETDKIKDEAVTNPKIAPQSIGPWKLTDNALSARLFKNFLGGNSFFHDDFFGAALLPVWTVAGGGNASTGWVGMCGNLDMSAPFGATETVNWNAKKNLNLDAVNPVFMVGLESVAPAVDDYITWRLTLLVDANNYVEFKAHDNAGVKPTWHARCVSGGVATDIDTTIPIEAGTGLDQHLRIEYTSTEVTFYINDVLVATIDTNIPTGCAEVQIELTNNHVTDDRFLTPDYVTIMGERP
jgi:hypothetical protein